MQLLMSYSIKALHPKLAIFEGGQVSNMRSNFIPQFTMKPVTEGGSHNSICAALLRLVEDRYKAVGCSHSLFVKTVSTRELAQTTTDRSGQLTRSWSLRAPRSGIMCIWSLELFIYRALAAFNFPIFIIESRETIKFKNFAALQGSSNGDRLANSNNIAVCVLLAAWGDDCKWVIGNNRCPYDRLWSQCLCSGGSIELLYRITNSRLWPLTRKVGKDRVPFAIAVADHAVGKSVAGSQLSESSPTIGRSLEILEQQRTCTSSTNRLLLVKSLPSDLFLIPLLHTNGEALLDTRENLDLWKILNQWINSFALKRCKAWVNSGHQLERSGNAGSALVRS
nr:hypothetical protein Iba_chr08cCG7500 [Ipomoea batatas]